MPAMALYNPTNFPSCTPLCPARDGPVYFPVLRPSLGRKIFKNRTGSSAMNAAVEMKP